MKIKITMDDIITELKTNHNLEDVATSCDPYNFEPVLGFRFKDGSTKTLNSSKITRIIDRGYVEASTMINIPEQDLMLHRICENIMTC